MIQSEPRPQQQQQNFFNQQANQVNPFTVPSAIQDPNFANASKKRPFGALSNHLGGSIGSRQVLGRQQTQGGKSSQKKSRNSNAAMEEDEFLDMGASDG